MTRAALLDLVVVAASAAGGALAALAFAGMLPLWWLNG